MVQVLEVELGNVSCRVGFVFVSNLSELKIFERESDLFNKRVDLNITYLHKWVKQSRFGLPIYLPTRVIAKQVST